MLKRLTAVAISILLLISATSVANATILNGGSEFEERTRKDPGDDIWVGLCVGASLDLSRASQRSCKRQQRAGQAEQRLNPAEPPNIGAGLCVGASLDLSRASQRSCEKQFPQTEQTTQSAPPTTYENHPQTYQHEPSTPSFQYAALGDSIAAGAGLPSVTSESCDRTTEAYPNTVAKKVGMQVANMACTGASMKNLLTEQDVAGANPAPQLDQAFQAGTPSLITITAGANDLRWDLFVRRCFTGTCGGPTDTRVTNKRITAVNNQTRLVLEQINQRSGGSPPKVIITGFYNPLSEACTTVQQKISADEIAWVEDRVTSLNQALESAAASASFATFVPIDFAGHDICSADPWVQSLHEAAPFHPTAMGQKAIARMIAQSY